MVQGLQCRECKRVYPKELLTACEECFAPLEALYDYDSISKTISKSLIESRPENLWRYRELLPLDRIPQVGLNTGGTPLIHAKRLGNLLGLKNLYVKDDSVNSPTLSFKDRVTAVAINKALEFRLEAVGCASTGNLAHAVAAQAASAGLPAYILIPHNLEAGKVAAIASYRPNIIPISGSYDDVNRLCSQIAERRPWGLVNVNLRPYYGEGSKTVAYEIAEQLGWKAPDAVVVPMAGGSLISKIHKGFEEFQSLRLIPERKTRLFGAQASGCNPITAAVKNGTDEITPVKPDTIAKSLAIGNPADGYYAASLIRKTGGWSEDVADAEIIEGIRLLAEWEGIFTETAGGVTVAVTRKLLQQGRIAPDDVTVIVITGNGLKTAEYLETKIPDPIQPKLADFEETLSKLSSGVKRREYAKISKGGFHFCP